MWQCGNALPICVLSGLGPLPSILVKESANSLLSSNTVRLFFFITLTILHTRFTPNICATQGNNMSWSPIPYLKVTYLTNKLKYVLSFYFGNMPWSQSGRPGSNLGFSVLYQNMVVCGQLALGLQPTLPSLSMLGLAPCCGGPLGLPVGTPGWMSQVHISWWRVNADFRWACPPGFPCPDRRGTIEDARVGPSKVWDNV